MSDSQPADPNTPQPEPFRPSLSFETVTFSDGQTLSFDEDEVVVFVGPNNAGKSAALRELQGHIARSIPQAVVKSVTLKKRGTAADLKSYLEAHAIKRGDTTNFSYGGIGYNINHNFISYFDGPEDRHPVAPFFSAYLTTETRLTASNPAPGIALYDEPPSHPIHLLLKDPALENTISKLFHRAFGNDLVTFRAGGSQFPLLVGQKPPLAQGEDALCKSYVEKLRAATLPLQIQGDGMRSFATVLLHVLVADNHSVVFLDEPEAFLHPPQARLLGEFIAKERRAKCQLFVATHSADVLDGLVASGVNKIRIVRIQRDGSVNRVKELSKEKTTAIVNDTLTRYSGVFEGIFYQHVVIAESDSDCLFYSSLLRTKSIAGDQQPDVLFVHASGKHRMVQMVDTLKSLGVPVSVVADIDILSEEAIFRNLFATLGGDWADVEIHWKTVKSGVEALRPPLTGEQAKGLIQAQLEDVAGVGPFPKKAEAGIKQVFKTLSPWDWLKQAGRSGIRGAPTVKHFDELCSECEKRGLWIVPVGELEGFCRSIDAGHGPAFVEKVLEERNLETDPELRDAREFVMKIWQAAKPQAEIPAGVL